MSDDEMPEFAAHWYNRAGEPCTSEEWASDFRTFAARYVGEHVWPDGTRVSTLWLGIDMGFSALTGGPPQVFETMVFGPDGDGPTAVWHEFQRRYHTEDQAVAGHAEIVAAIDEVVPGEPFDTSALLDAETKE